MEPTRCHHVAKRSRGLDRIQRGQQIWYIRKRQPAQDKGTRAEAIHAGRALLRLAKEFPGHGCGLTAHHGILRLRSVGGLNANGSRHDDD
jgi:hypothetical protein